MTDTQSLLLLPRGFEYLSYGWTGDTMSDGVATPSLHDGMAAFSRGKHKVQLVRNHEVSGFGGRFTDPAYDPDAGGGTSTVTFDLHHGHFDDSYGSLSGTVRNCAGGPTPWGTWLTCEETGDVNPSNGIRHGYVFEVPNNGKGNPEPLREMGRFAHEAVAVDPHTGFVYETEDDNIAGLFRFRPRCPGELSEGGVLEMLMIGDSTHDTRSHGTGTKYRHTSWVRIDDPDPDLGEPRVTDQGIAKGGAIFSRLEGAWYGNGFIYIVSRNGRMRNVFASPGEDVLSNPDNIAVSPRGGLVLCEDGSGFANIQTPGISFAITGPWQQGSL